MSVRSSRTLFVRVGGPATALLLAAGVLGAQAPATAAAATTASTAARAGDTGLVAGAVSELRQHAAELGLSKDQAFSAPTRSWTAPAPRTSASPRPTRGSTSSAATWSSTRARRARSRA